jgi:hypothetical protein
MQHPEADDHRIEALVGEGQVLGVALLEPGIRMKSVSFSYHVRGEVDAYYVSAAIDRSARNIPWAGSDVQDLDAFPHSCAIEQWLTKGGGEASKVLVVFISRGIPAGLFEVSESVEVFGRWRGHITLTMY